jgi:hypothetical protein
MDMVHVTRDCSTEINIGIIELLLHSIHFSASPSSAAGFFEKL